MINLIKNKNLSNEELEKLDDYFFDDHIDELLNYDFLDIVNFIELIEQQLGFSYTKNSLSYKLTSLTFEYKVFFDPVDIKQYKKVLEMINHFSFTDAGLAYVLGDYYYYENNPTEALKYYQMIFKDGFDLYEEGYFDSLNRYLTIYDFDKIEFLKSLISESSKKDYSLDFINTYLLLISKLDKNSLEYINYIDEVLLIVKSMVLEYQGKNQDSFIISDSDIERNLCELLALKMEYFVNKLEYKKAFDLYNELTIEIKKSGCLRYYHARDLFYNQMIKHMSKNYVELKFFDNISNKTFKLLTNLESFSVNQEIVLENEFGATFSFIVISVYKDTEIIIAPILPIIGVGGNIFTTLVIKDEVKYLKNKL